MMRKLIVLMSFFNTITILGQIPVAENIIDRYGQKQGKWMIGFNQDWKQTKDTNELVYYRLITYVDNIPYDTVHDYFANGILQWKGKLIKDQPFDMIDGYSYYFYENGNKKIEAYYSSGNPDKKWVYFTNKGNFSHEIDYEDSTKTLLIQNTRSDLLNNKIDVKQYVQIVSSFYSDHRRNNWYANDLSNIGYTLVEKNRFNDAIFLYNISLDVLDKGDDKLTEEYAFSLNNLASAYSRNGNYLKALDLNQECLELRRKIYGEHHLYFALSLNNIAYSLESKGDYLMALDYQFQSLKILNRSKTKYYCLVLSNIGNNYSNLKDFNKSILFGKKAVECKCEIIGKDNDDYYLSLKNLVHTYMNIGNYLEGNLLLKECYDYYFTKREFKTPQYIDLMETWIDFKEQICDYSQAKPLHEELINFHKLNGDKVSMIKSLRKLCLLQLKTNDFENATYIFQEYQKLSKENDYTEFTLEEAEIYSRFGNYAKSNKILKSCIPKLWNTYDYPRAKILQSNNYIHLNKQSDAYKSCIEAAKWGSIVEKDEQIFYDFIVVVMKLKEFKYADSVISVLCNNTLDAFKKNSSTLTTNECIEYKNKLNTSLNLMFNYSIQRRISNPKLIYQAYNLWVTSNGLLNSVLSNTFDIQKSKEDTLRTELFNNYRILKNQLLLFEQMPNSEAHNSERINELKNKISIIEREINIKSLSHDIFKRDITFVELKNNLELEECFVDLVYMPFIDSMTHDYTGEYKSIAFISSSKDNEINYLLLENEFDFIDKYNASKHEEYEIIDNVSNNKYPLYNSFWKPISEKIGDAKTIYVSLGGIYNNINLSTIYNPETGKYLLEEKDIRIVNSVRDFVLSKEREKKNYSSNTASLFGFPNFDGNTTVSADTSDLFASTRNLNSFWLDSLTRGGMKAKPLPATKTEVENISATLKSKGWQVNSFLADNASETNIKNQQSPRILHVATHGYFFQDIPVEKDNTRFLGMDRHQVVQDPMLRSGLLLTGANKTLKGETSSGENGLLSAAEASLLDLRETELVVLSACETGKGEVNNSEGVYGLRKAFSDAGAQNIIMSLWKVDDNVTQEFMSRFYEFWLNDKTSIREAFNKTQLEIKAKYPQPYYWGAFILVGE